MLTRLHLAFAIALLALLPVVSTGCGKSVETAFRDFTDLYGNIADILETVYDVESAEAAAPEIEALVPRIMEAGQEMARASARITDPKDVDMAAMMACAQQQQRLAIQLKRLTEDEEVWSAIQPALAKTMLLKAMPPR
ncbi:MAG: hypothetical protein ACYST0_01160 [Planctomycetota bacterium]|jgi:hypothetical protein